MGSSFTLLALYLPPPSLHSSGHRDCSGEVQLCCPGHAGALPAGRGCGKDLQPDRRGSRLVEGRGQWPSKWPLEGARSSLAELWAQPVMFLSELGRGHPDKEWRCIQLSTGQCRALLSQAPSVIKAPLAWPGPVLHRGCPSILMFRRDFLQIGWFPSTYVEEEGVQ